MPLTMGVVMGNLNVMPNSDASFDTCFHTDEYDVHVLVARLWFAASVKAWAAFGSIPGPTIFLQNPPLLLYLRPETQRVLPGLLLALFLLPFKVVPLLPLSLSLTAKMVLVGQSC